MADPWQRGGGDAEVLRRVLEGLSTAGAAVDGVGVAGGLRGPAVMGLPAPPAWATHSVVEDGGVTHERVSALHPLAWLDRHYDGPALTCPTDVSVSVVDRPGAVRWVRLPPTIQIEGGSYSVVEARRLVLAIKALLGVVG